MELSVRMQSLALSAGSSASRWCSGNARREVIDAVPLPYAVVMRPHTDYLHRSVLPHAIDGDFLVIAFMPASVCVHYSVQCGKSKCFP